MRIAIAMPPITLSTQYSASAVAGDQPATKIAAAGNEAGGKQPEEA